MVGGIGGRPLASPRFGCADCGHRSCRRPCSLTGNRVRDAMANRTVGLSLVHPLDESLARRAAQLRGRARAVSAADAIVVATAELLEALVVTGDPDALARLSQHANGVALLPA